MITLAFPLWYIAVFFLGLLGVWALYALFNIAHVLKFGYINYISYLMTFILLGLTVIILFIAYEQLQGIDWSDPIRLF